MTLIVVCPSMPIWPFQPRLAAIIQIYDLLAPNYGLHVHELSPKFSIKKDLLLTYDKNLELFKMCIED